VTQRPELHGRKFLKNALTGEVGISTEPVTNRNSIAVVFEGDVALSQPHLQHSNALQDAYPTQLLPQ
jgi:hypothetical protein